MYTLILMRAVNGIGVSKLLSNAIRIENSGLANLCHSINMKRITAMTAHTPLTPAQRGSLSNLLKVSS